MNYMYLTMLIIVIYTFGFIIATVNAIQHKYSMHNVFSDKKESINIVLWPIVLISKTSTLLGKGCLTYLSKILAVFGFIFISLIGILYTAFGSRPFTQTKFYNNIEKYERLSKC